MGNNQAKHAVGIVVTVLGVAAAVAVGTAQTNRQPQPLKQFLEDNGWVSLPMPDRKMGPGSVLKVIKTGDSVSVQWLGNLRRCGITDEEFGFARGKYPAIGIGKVFSVKASVATGYLAKLHGTADLANADGAFLRIEVSGGDAVDVQGLADWLATPNAPERMPNTCNNILAQDDIYLVTEALRVSQAVYALVDKNGGKLPVAGAAFERTDPDSFGTVSVVDDVYFAVRRVKRLAPILFEPNVPQSVPDADGLLRLVEP
jgi:hypothetical protein